RVAGGSCRTKTVDGDLGVARPERLPDPLREEPRKRLPAGALENPAEKVRIGRLVGESLAVRAAQGFELAEKALEIGELWRRVPTGCHAIAGEGTGLVEIVLLEIETHRHVEDLAHRGIAIGRVGDLGNITGDFGLDVEKAIADQAAGERAGDRLADREDDM